MKTRVKNENVFLRLYDCTCFGGGPEKWDVDDEENGRKQFKDFQSKGILPDCPNPYFLVLVAGKKSADWLTREMYLEHKAWEAEESLSIMLLQAYNDWQGEHWILNFLLGWYPKLANKPLPRWITDAQRG